jgi:hypothetical protein
MKANDGSMTCMHIIHTTDKYRKTIYKAALKAKYSPARRPYFPIFLKESSKQQKNQHQPADPICHHPRHNLRSHTPVQDQAL